MSQELLAVAPDPRIGLLVQERYRILEKLGEGGMGVVYAGEHTLIHRKVAIKCLHPQFTTNADMIARFRREAMAANAIRHPNIVEVTDMGRFDEGGVFLVLEFLEGLDLASLLAKERVLTVARTVHIVSQVCDALSVAHAARIVHRDLKPENIFLTRRNEDADFVKVLDFGIAKFAQAAGPSTRAGTMIGTPHYMSPEHAFGSRELDHRADIYSLGVVLFHCLSGVLPFDDETYPGMLMKIVSMEAPLLGSVSPSIPAKLAELVERILSKDPDARPQSCAEVKAALAPFRELDASFAATKPPLARVTTPIDPFEHTTPVQAGASRSESQTELAVPMRGQGIGKWLAGAAVVLLAGTVVLLTIDLGSKPAAPQAARHSVLAHRSPAPARVRIQIDTAPQQAQLFLDGAAIANPFDADVLGSDRPRRLEARLAGYRPLTQALALSASQRIHLTLQPEQARAAPPPVAPAHSSRRVRIPAPVVPSRVAAPSAPVEPPRRTYRPVVSPDEL